MNIQLAGTEEFIDGKNTGTLGMVLIRCNNVLWVRGAGEGGDGVGERDGEVKKEGERDEDREMAG